MTNKNKAKTNTDIIRGYQLLSEVLRGFVNAPVLLFDFKANLIFEQMREQRVRVAMDLRIGAIALSNNLV